MLSFNYEAPMYSFMTLVDNINYLYEDISREKVKTLNEDVKTEASNPTKKRILTYYRNELLVMRSHNIAYAFTENGITYIVNKEGKKSIANQSLDNLYSELNTAFFFKVSKNMIIRMTAIKNIVTLDKGLKVETNPATDKAIIIKEKKVLAFNKWFKKD